MVLENQTTKKSYHVLIIDGDPEMARVLETALNNVSYATTVASDGNEGLAVAETKFPDLIVMDLMLPRRSGFLVLERLIQTLEHPIPVIIVTGNLGDRHRAYAEMLGVAAYFHKPVKLPQLLEKIDEILNRSEMKNE